MKYNKFLENSKYQPQDINNYLMNFFKAQNTKNKVLNSILLNYYEKNFLKDENEANIKYISNNKVVSINKDIITNLNTNNIFEEEPDELLIRFGNKKSDINNNNNAMELKFHYEPEELKHRNSDLIFQDNYNLNLDNRNEKDTYKLNNSLNDLKEINDLQNIKNLSNSPNFKKLNLNFKDLNNNTNNILNINDITNINKNEDNEEVGVYKKDLIKVKRFRPEPKKNKGKTNLNNNKSSKDINSDNLLQTNQDETKTSFPQFCIKNFYLHTFNIEDMHKVAPLKKFVKDQDIIKENFLEKECYEICGKALLCPEMLPMNCQQYMNANCDCVHKCKQKETFYQDFIKKNTSFSDLEF